MGVRYLLIVFLILGFAVFARYYKQFPRNLKGWILRILAVSLILLWVYLLFKVRL